ncbi:MAG: hypothetical protein J6Y65_01190 [Eggerthellaceae bacterium]|nr:hypothetical protein [Eggerthellaceae bacterium]
MDMRNKDKRQKGGFSIAEAVIAMAVISIISIVAISVVQSGVETQGKSISSFKTRTLSQNVLECFKVAADYDEFSFLVLSDHPLSGHMMLGGRQPDTSSVYPDQNRIEMYFDCSDYDLFIDVGFNDIASLKGPWFIANAVSRDDPSKVLFAYTYSKGVEFDGGGNG